MPEKFSSRRLVAGLSLCATILAAGPARADLEVCNRHDEGLKVAYAVPFDFAREIADCTSAYTFTSGSCYYSGWMVGGWWRVESGECEIVYDHTVYSGTFVHFTTDSGQGPENGRPFLVVDEDFSFHEDTQTKSPNSDFCNIHESVWANSCPGGRDAVFMELPIEEPGDVSVDLVVGE
ncbi:DUF1036 domain-containing protein [Nannocystis sp. SCPEA4]|uniref:DUF1036 domain-containing protein n=1 Tax=Nannocystis sp. SCPEA4 TaxID=2996787 RepID=UPI00226EF2E5|nr:DUF1036 domain-containing protein [Nannocystis sp. SCPEA4]MCY1060235.1 DUF1036 domain-containing protein [Nannocystis sp. SCPEA4]